MAEDRNRYDQYVDEALRGVARRVLRDIARDGLTGNHHFYISFRTGAAGVELPEYLRSRYPEEITIVLQHQFWGLEIDEKQFSVTVSFNKQNERLTVPFAALTAFVDPSVRFGLQFEDVKGEGGAAAGGQNSNKSAAPAGLQGGASNAIPGPGAGRSNAGKSAGGRLVGSSRDAAPGKDGMAKDGAGKDGAAEPAIVAADGAGKADVGKSDGANKVVTLDAFRKK